MRSGWALLVAAALGCAARPRALDYVVLPNAEEPARISEARARAEAQEDPDDAWPIYAAPDLGTGGADCGPGLIGTECERGLLADQPPLESLDLLGPDAVVIEDWDLSPQRASGAAPDPGPPRRGAPAPAPPASPRTRGR